METDAKKLLKVQDAVRQMVANGESTDYIDNFLAQQGETPDSISAINKFGADAVANVRKSREEYESGATRRNIKALAGAIPEGVRAGEDVVFSMGEEALRDLTAGLYGDKFGKEGYERRKQAVKEEARQGGYYPFETVARGLSGATGMFASPIFRLGGSISPLAQALMGPAAYSGIKEFSKGGTPSDIALASAGGAAAGGIGYGIGKGIEKVLTSGAGATSGLGKDIVSDVKDAGARGSKAFKTGQKMSDAEFAQTMNNKVADIKSAATEKFVSGKNAIGNKAVDKVSLLDDYQNAYAGHVSSGGLVNEEAEKVYRTAEKMIEKFLKIKKPTVSDVDMLKRNIGNIAADTNTALQARTELYNITKNAADLATGGEYGAVMEPFTETMNALVDMGRVSKSAPDWSAQTAGVLRKVKTEFGKETIKKMLGQDTYDMILGKLTSAPLSGKTGVITGLSALLSGNIPFAVGIGSATSPKVVGDVAYWAGKNIPTLAETLGPIAVKSSEVVNPAKLILP